MKTLIPLAVVDLALLLSLRACSQVPSQFASLPTTSTDYTCVGVVPCSTWSMPSIPTPGGSFTDSTYGTTIYRLPSTSSTAALMPTYSRVQAWNSSNTLMMVTALTQPVGVTTALYDATKTPPQFINYITPSDGYAVDGADNDALWAYTDAHRIYYNVGISTSHGLELRYIDISGCTVSSCSPTPVVVHTFSCTTDSTSSLGPGVPGNKIETGSGAQGSMFDSTDRYFVFTCDKVDTNGRHEIDIIRYDRTLDTFTHEKWYNLCVGTTPTGCATYNTIGSDTDLIRLNLHPSGSYISIIWQSGGRDGTWTRGEGTEIFDPSFTFLGPASPYDGHQDMGYDVSGVPVWVGVGSFRNDTIDDRAISITNLTTLSTTAQTYRRILLPCTYNRTGPGCNVGTDLTAKTGASHISMTGSLGSLHGYGLMSTMILAGQYRPALPDWPTGTTLGTTVSGAGTATVTPASMAQIGNGVVSTVGSGASLESVTWSGVTSTTATATFVNAHASTDSVKCLSCGDTGWGAMENIVLKIDSSASDGSNATFYRLNRTMGIRDNWYNAEPHSTVNRDFTQVIFGSSWNQDINSNYVSANTGVNAWWVSLTSSAPPATSAGAFFWQIP